ncbi:unnamed protein product [Allacma fusca]|uniref:Uncharacterized protein n=3 Tax=Allacma fusca TaxID=39272 RepID=A0A8J2M2M5_9HEXA|nr:unnamed protein product [Allacma fusca]
MDIDEEEFLRDSEEEGLAKDDSGEKGKEKQIAKASKKKSGAQRKKDAKAKGHHPVTQSNAKDGKSSEQGKRIPVPKPKKPWSELSCETSTVIVTVAGDMDA